MQLTKHEIRIKELLIRGMSNKDIATTIGKAEKTVRYHLSKLYKKYGVTSKYKFLASLIKDTNDSPEITR